MTRDSSRNVFYIICDNWIPVDLSGTAYSRADNDPALLLNLLQAGPLLEMDLLLNHFPIRGRCVIRKFCLNEEEGSLLCEWKRLGFASSIEGEELDYIGSSCRPAISREYANTQGSSLRIHLSLRPQEVVMLRISKA